jgi:hypothetical protein
VAQTDGVDNGGRILRRVETGKQKVASSGLDGIGSPAQTEKKKKRSRGRDGPGAGGSERHGLGNREQRREGWREEPRSVSGGLDGIGNPAKPMG